jgi:hypothetical protein
MKELPTVEQAGAIAVEISEKLSEPMEAREQAFFVAGFQEAVKYLKSGTGACSALSAGDVIQRGDLFRAYRNSWYPVWCPP